jgi:hypothetical protein
VKKAIWILWPSFVVAGAGTVLLFSLLDPVDFRLIGPLELGRAAGYTIGFFLLWAFAAASSAFTCFLQRTAEDVNRCPLQPVERPLGCPKRKDAHAIWH